MSAPGCLNNSFFGAGNGSGGVVPINPNYKIPNSVSFENLYIERTGIPVGQNTTQFTYSAWYLNSRFRYATGTDVLMAGQYTATSTDLDVLGVTADGNITFFRDGSAPASFATVGSAFLVDQSAWYHIIVAVDSAQAVQADRVKVYVNGEEQVVNVTMSQGQTVFLDNERRQQIGSTTTFCKLADIQFISGQQLGPSAFGFTDANGVWQPKAFSGTVNSRDFRLDFADPSGGLLLLADAFGNGTGFNGGILLNPNHAGPSKITDDASYAGLPIYNTSDADFACAAPAGVRNDPHAGRLELCCPLVDSNGTAFSSDDLFPPGRISLEKFASANLSPQIGVTPSHHYLDGSAVRFNGNAYSQWANNTAWFWNNDILEVEVWVHPRNANPGTFQIFSKSNNTFSGTGSRIDWAVTFTDSNRVQLLGTQNATKAPLVLAEYLFPTYILKQGGTANTPQVNREDKYSWHHVVLQMDNSNPDGIRRVSLWWNGQCVIKEVQDTTNIFTPNGGQPLYVGGNGGDRLFQDFRVYKGPNRKYIPGVGYRLFTRDPQLHWLFENQNHVSVDSPQAWGDYLNRSNEGGVVRGNYARFDARPSNSTGNRETPIFSGGFKFQSNFSSNNNKLFFYRGYRQGRAYSECYIYPADNRTIDPDNRFGLYDKTNYERYNTDSNTITNPNSNGFEWRPNGQYYGGPSGALVATGAYIQSLAHIEVYGFDLNFDTNTVTVLRDNNPDYTFPLNSPEALQLCQYKTNNSVVNVWNHGQYPYYYPPRDTSVRPQVAELFPPYFVSVPSGIYRGNNSSYGNGLCFMSTPSDGQFVANGTGFLWPDIITTTEGFSWNAQLPGYNDGQTRPFFVGSFDTPASYSRGIING